MATTFTSVTRYQPGTALWVGGSGGPLLFEEEVRETPAEWTNPSEANQQEEWAALLTDQ